MADVAADTGRGFIDVNAVFGPDHGTAGTAGAPLDTLVAERRVTRHPPVARLLAARDVGRRPDRQPARRRGRRGPGERPGGHRGRRSAADRATPGGSSTRPSGRVPSATGSMAGTARRRPRNPSARSSRAVAATGRPLLVPIVASSGPASVDRRGDRRAGDPGRAPRRALHAHRRRPRGRGPLPAPPPRDERAGALPGDRDGRRVDRRRAAAVRDGQSDPGRRIADQRDPRRVDPGRRQARDPRRQRRPAVRRWRTDRSI